MNTRRTKQILNVDTSKVSVNNDTFLKVNLDSKERLLPLDEINRTVNLGDRFNLERQRSTFYRILGTINPIISNPLFNLNDTTFDDKQTLAGFNSYTFLDTSYPKDNNLSDSTDIIFSESISKNLKELNGWFGYFDPDKSKSGLCNFIDMEPTRERFSFIPDTKPFSGVISPIKNWEITITYPNSADKGHNMVNGGLLLADAISVISSTRNMIAFGVACKHNLLTGDSVKIIGTNGYDGTHEVIRTGLDNGDLKDYYFVIDLPPTGTIDSNSRMLKIVNGVESEYYFRKFKKVKTRDSNVVQTDDYETYKLAFSETVYSDPSTQFVFNDDIDISYLTDNLGRPLSELYLTIIKTDSAGLFGNISSGIITPYIQNLTSSGINTYLRNIPAISRIHNGTTPFISHNALETQVAITTDDFYGDLVEFNKTEVIETVLAEVSHRFNTLNRESFVTISGVTSLGEPPKTEVIKLGPRQEGYVYKPHTLIKIRDFSSYIEQGDINIDEIPSYGVTIDGSRYLWRDILEIGFSDGVNRAINYPFLNGCHYMYQNNLFYVKRQDPFSKWGLFYGRFPADPIGEQITNNFKTNSEDSVY